MLGHAPVAAGEAQAEVGEVRPGAPHLRAVENPRIAVARRARLHTGEVGSRDRFGEELTPQLVTGQDARQVAELEVVGRVGQHHLRAHTERGATGDAEVRQHEVLGLLGERELVRTREALAAELRGPGDAGEARFVELLLLRTLGVDLLLGELVLAAQRARGGDGLGGLAFAVRFEPGAGLGAELVDRDRRVGGGGGHAVPLRVRGCGRCARGATRGRRRARGRWRGAAGRSGGRAPR